MKYDLSILIPARNEVFLAKTIENLLENIEGKTEIIAVLDGEWADPPIVEDERVTIVYHSESIGQRAATNEAAKLSNAKYLMKVDAHCSFDKGFDRILMEDMQPDWTLVPTMKNLHAFDWVCPSGHRRYQGPSGVCKECGKETEMDIIWKGKDSPNSTSYTFDRTLHFQYWGGYKKKQIGDLVESMSLQGSCFMVTREKYWELELCDEAHGSWGQQGVEVACKTWLSGGKVMVSRKTWYAHMFRTQGGDFTFPYPNRSIAQARRFSRDLWLNNKWDKAIHPFSWLIDKFQPPDWGFTKGIVYYTENELDPEIMEKCQKKLKKSAGEYKIVSVSLKPIDFEQNIHLPLKKGYLTMFKQILAGLEALDTDIVFLCEHDVLYHPTHFDFVPHDKERFFYNTNVWKVRTEDGLAMRTANCKQTSGLCADRKLLLEHYRKRVEIVEKNGYTQKMGFEPGTHGRDERVDDYGSNGWESKWPNVDIRHKKNLTKSRWKKEEFRNQRYTKGWQETNNIPGWGSYKHLWRKI